jgi:4-diphosphocytidyl-2-C-methyl-D-erythritol kinase
MNRKAARSVSSHAAEPSLALPRSAESESISPAGVRLYAPAKINLNLLVGPRQHDGYHPLDSLVAKISLYDEIDLRPRNDGRIAFRAEGLPCGPDGENLAFRAARALAEGRNVPGAEIVLRKQIPPGGGLGGGSSDAAAVLKGLNEVWNLRLEPPALAQFAEALGSDVPLFLGPPACRMTGRGQTVRPLDAHPFWAVLVLPDLVCSTAEVYHAFDARPTEKLAEQLDAALFRRPPSTWRGQLVNQLTEPALRVCPALRPLQDRLAQAAGLPVCLTGSGAAMFLLCDDQVRAEAVLAGLPDDLRRLGRIVRNNPW